MGRLMRLPQAAAWILLIGSVLTTGRVSAQSGETEVIAVVEAYHAALASGDSTTALSLLSDEVVILESGNLEDKDHYRSGHLAGDMRFAQAIRRESDAGIEVRRVGNAAWTWSTSTRRGRLGDRDVNSRGAELMVLRLVDGRWLIEAIHWSSRSGGG